MLFLVAAALFLMGVELVRLGAARPAGTKPWIRTLCRGILGALLLACGLILGLFLYAGAGMLATGQTGQGVCVLASGAIFGLCVYFWLLRGWLGRARHTDKEP